MSGLLPRYQDFEAANGNEPNAVDIQSQLEVEKHFQPHLEVIMEFTKDPYLLNQYYRVREELYQHDLGLSDFSGQEDHYDRMGDILIVRDGLKVIGGARINYSTPEKRVSLVMEEGATSLNELCADLQLERSNYCEFSRLALLPEYRHNGILREIVVRLIQHAQQEHMKYLFIISPFVLARTYKRIGASIGVNYHLLPEIKTVQKAIYGGLGMILSYAELTPIYENSISLKQ